MATAHRVGELQALSDMVGFNRDGSMLLSFAPEFIAKTESWSNRVDRDFKIEGLSTLTTDSSELLLCPVKAVKKYLKMTQSPNRAKRLFVSPRSFKRPLSKNAISFFLKKVITDAYKDIPDNIV